MARVNIEDRFLASSDPGALARLLKTTEFEAIGLVLLFWRDSQDKKRVKGYKKEILRWARFESWKDGHENNGVSAKDFINAFVEIGIIDPISCSEHTTGTCSEHTTGTCSSIGDDVFLIRGNEKHVQALIEYEAGNASRKAERNKKAQKAANARWGKKGDSNDKAQASQVDGVDITSINSSCSEHATDVCSSNAPSNAPSRRNTNQYKSNHNIYTECSSSSITPPPNKINKTIQDRAPCIVSLWNRHRPKECPKAKGAVLPPKYESLWAEKWALNPDEKFWVGLLRDAARSDYLTGKTASKNGKTFLLNIRSFLTLSDEIALGAYQTAAGSVLEFKAPDSWGTPEGYGPS